MTKLKAAVIGTGYLGRFHAQKFADHDQCELCFVYDRDLSRAAKVAEELSCRASEDLDVILSQVDCVSIVTSTRSHFELALKAIEAGRHVLIEKPLTHDAATAEQLVSLIQGREQVFQVGHIERFNPVAREFLRRHRPESFAHYTFSRMTPFQPRGADVDVIMDLMIHDIDLMFSFFPDSEVQEIVAWGQAGILSKDLDYVHATLRLCRGQHIVLQAGRITGLPERKLRAVNEQGLVELDLARSEYHRFSCGQDGLIASETAEIQRRDGLADEIDSFLQAIATKGEPKVTLKAGHRNILLAERLRDTVREVVPK